MTSPGRSPPRCGPAQEAERLAAPAEAHRHYDEALALWDRVNEPEKLAGMDRGIAGVLLGHQRRCQRRGRPRGPRSCAGCAVILAGCADPALISRVCERLAYFLLETNAFADAVEAARAGVDALPEDPPSREWARGAGHPRPDPHVCQGRGSRDRRRQAGTGGGAGGIGATWVEADALVTLGQLSERGGQVDEAIRLYTMAHDQAREAQMLGVELRAAFQLARSRLERGDLTGAVRRPPTTGCPGRRRSGLGLAPVRPGPAVPALPGALRRRQLGSRAGTGGRVRRPGDHRGRGPAVGDGPVRRRGAGATRSWRSGAPGWSRSGRPTSSASTSPAGCSPSTRCGAVTPRAPWRRWPPRSRPWRTRTATARRRSGSPRSGWPLTPAGPCGHAPPVTRPGRKP